MYLFILSGKYDEDYKLISHKIHMIILQLNFIFIKLLFVIYFNCKVYSLLSGNSVLLLQETLHNVRKW